MCNLSEGIAERHFCKGLAVGEAKGITIGEAKGRAIGEAKGIAIGEAKGEQKMKKFMVMNLLKRQIPVPVIAETADITEEQVKQLGKENGLL